MKKSDIKKIYYNGNEITSLYWGGNLIYTKTSEKPSNLATIKGYLGTRNINNIDTDYMNIFNEDGKYNHTKLNTDENLYFEVETYLPPDGNGNLRKLFSPVGYPYKEHQTTISELIEFIDTSNYTDFSNLFNNFGNNMSYNFKFDFSKLNTSNAKTMRSMFETAKIEDFDISSFDTSNVENMEKMFCNFKGSKIDVSNFDISKCKTIASMFVYSYTYDYQTKYSEVVEINLGNNFIIPSGCSHYYIFKGLGNLTTITGNIQGITYDYFMLNHSPLTNDSAMVIINGLSTVTKSSKVVFSQTTYDDLSQEQIALATSKGWSVVRY